MCVCTQVRMVGEWVGFSLLVILPTVQMLLAQPVTTG